MMNNHDDGRLAGSREPNPQEAVSALPGFDPGREEFARIFETPHGQLLAFLTQDDVEKPGICVMGALVRGVRPQVKLSYDDEEAQARGFAELTSDTVNEIAASLHCLADGLDLVEEQPQ